MFWGNYNLFGGTALPLTSLIDPAGYGATFPSLMDGPDLAVFGMGVPLLDALLPNWPDFTQLEPLFPDSAGENNLDKLSKQRTEQKKADNVRTEDSGEITEDQQAALEEFNKKRREQGLPEAKLDPGLCEKAQKQADDIQQMFGPDSIECGHEGLDGSNPFERLADFKNPQENAAGGQQSWAEAIQCWMDSTVGHRDNMVKAEYTKVGFGRKGNKWVMTFAEA